jgi:hypothetical protein
MFCLKDCLEANGLNHRGSRQSRFVQEHLGVSRFLTPGGTQSLATIRYQRLGSAKGAKETCTLVLVDFLEGGTSSMIEPVRLPAIFEAEHRLRAAFINPDGLIEEEPHGVAMLVASLANLGSRNLTLDLVHGKFLMR